MAKEESRLAATKRLGTELLTSRSHINNCPALLSIISSSFSSEHQHSVAPDQTDCVAEAVRSLQAFFVPLFRSGELGASAKKRVRESLGGASSPGGEEDKAGAIYRAWVWDKYKELVEVLLQVLQQHQFPSLQSIAMSALMEFVRMENVGEFSTALYFKICATLICTEALNKEIFEVLISHYLKYSDVCYFTACNMEKLAARIKQNQVKCGDSVIGDVNANEDSSGESAETSVRNVYYVLSLLSTTPVAKEISAKEFWVEGFGKKEEKSCKDSFESTSCEKGSNKWRTSKEHRLKRTKAWLSFLQLTLPIDLYKNVLSQLHKLVIPNLSSPILLSDFLTKSYDIGGLISVMALNGLFILVTKHGLEYPDFYNKLYALLEPSIFMAKYRARFFELLDACLKSSHLPSYLAAAFAKKIGRIALFAPPAGGLVAVAIIHNLLRRHPSINCLVHRHDSVKRHSNKTITQDSEPDLEEKVEAEVPAVEPEKDVIAKLGADPFKASENDIASCDALQSSLWEIETLRRHYCPAVSRFVASLETDLTVRAKTTEVAVGDFSSGSYETIFAEEVGRRLKHVPLAFYKAIPTSLFPQQRKTSASLDEKKDCDFLGWNFSESVMPESEIKGGDNKKSSSQEFIKDNEDSQMRTKTENLGSVSVEKHCEEKKFGMNDTNCETVATKKISSATKKKRKASS